MQFEQKVVRDDELLCQAMVKIACLDAVTFRPRSIPSFFVDEDTR
jgi:acyl-CoA thioester hydrolase